VNAPVPPMRLGFAVKVLGEHGLKSNDARKWQSNPHLRVSIEYLHAIFGYLAKHDISMYRMSSDVAPYITHPTMPQFHGQVKECRKELEALGKVAREQNLRLSFHPSQYVLLNSPDAKIVTQSVKDLVAQAEILDVMGLGPEAVLVTHVGGTYGDPAAGRERWATTYKNFPSPPAVGWCSRTTTCGTRRPTRWPSTRGPACGWCSTTSTTGA